MLTRIVKMTFDPTKVEEFLNLFNKSKKEIRKMKGCTHLELMQDHDHKNSFSTVSHWEDEESLNNYRNSDVFKEVWPKTKLLFIAKPIAFSLEEHTIVD